jgi:hypothetical protein
MTPNTRFLTVPASRIVVSSKTPDDFVAEHQGEPDPYILTAGGHTRALRWDQLSIYFFPEYALVYDDKKWRTEAGQPKGKGTP